MPTTIEHTIRSFKALSEEIRLRLLLVLLDREACVCELMEVYDMAQSKLSHHLISLRQAGFLQSEKRGKWNYYRAHPALVTPLNKELISLLVRTAAGEGASATIFERDRAKLETVQRRTCSC